MANYKIFPKQRSIIILLLLWAFAAFNGFSQTKITGKVISLSDNEGLPGATVLLKGTTTGVVTDLDGNYSITVNSGKDVLVFSMVGMVPQEIEVGSQAIINISLETKVTGLDEVVVIGYGVVKKSDLTGSVSSVKSKDLTAVPVTDALESLQGKVSGMDLTKNSGQSGAKMNITIRGNRSLGANNAPLILVDGVDYGDNLDINPNDIQSIEVLKDGSSTAIYGSRGANGVIIVTTKRGVEGKTKISYNGYYGSNTVSMYPQFTDGPQWMDMHREANSSIGRTSGNWKSIADDPAIFNKFALQGKFVDWRNLLIHQGDQQSHQVNISGGNENTLYSVSTEYGQEQGIVKFDNLKRYVGRLSLDQKVYKWMKIGSSMAFTYTNQSIRANPFNQANKIQPVGYAYDTITGLINPYPLYDNNTLNPLIEEAPGVKSTSRITNRFFSVNYLELNPSKELSIKTSLGVDYSTNRKGMYSGAQSFQQLNTISVDSVENKIHSKFLWENTITYDKTLGIHNFQIMGGASFQTTQDEDYRESASDMLSSAQQWYALQNSSGALSVYSLFGKDQLQSYFGRINYKLKDKYLLTATLRWDGASELAPGHQGQYFPSIAVAWKVNEEDFLKDVIFLTSLKLRASYGVVGNSAVGRYATQGFLGQTVNSFDETSAYGYYPEFLPNKSLGWETTASRDLGIDFGLFKNRITGTINYYYQNTYDLLLKEALPTHTGFPYVIANIGKTENKGWEVTLSSVNIDGGMRGFKWNTDFNFSINKGKVLDLGPNGDIIYDPQFSTGDNNNVVHKVGAPVVSFLDYQKIGIWQKSDSAEAAIFRALPGDIKLRNVNSDSAFTPVDRVLRGHANPDWSMGLNNTFSFRGIELSCFIYARVGQTVRYEGYYGWKYAGDANTTVQDYWTYNNPTNFFPRPGNGSAGAYTKNYITTLQYADGSFLKIRDITAAYTLPSKWASKLKMSKFRIYTTLKNYFTFTKIKGYDPEGEDMEDGNCALSFPMTKQWVFGVNVEF